MQNSEISYWALRGNPSIFSVEEAVAKAIREQKEVYWVVANRKVRKGDRAIIWKTQGKKTKNNKQQSGIIALAEVLENPKLMKDPDSDFWEKLDMADSEKIRVRVRLLASLNLPLWEGESNVEVIERKELTVQSKARGTAFRVESYQWDDIMDAIGGWPDKSF